jgi:hypothetical protein
MDRRVMKLDLKGIECPTTYQTQHFFNNSETNEDIATKQTRTTDKFLFISHTMNVLMLKSRCNIFIGFRIIKEMPGLVGSGTPGILRDVVNDFITGFSSRTLGMHESTGNFLAT